MDFALARHNMVEGQIRTNRVTDQLVIEVLEKLPREAFAPDAIKTLAYVDEDHVVADGRIMMEPMVAARLMQTAHIQASDLVLVVAAATGFEAAAIAGIAGAVIAVESNPELAAAAEARMAEQGADTVTVVQGDVAAGHPDQAPYDVIFINGAVETVPAALTDQMAEGGRLVCVRKSARGSGKAVLLTKSGGVVSERDVFDANIPALPEFKTPPAFSF
ncbi:MAG: methyltransferase domain-containing protein [Alphaproteobacteria bacterium]|nr:methyltransferase domain-containing protein [Alphaproteobacteria bacterium]MBF0250205.1 methyltransferase domain-containing protein [Alphaproteobacteria bacterium]